MLREDRMVEIGDTMRDGHSRGVFASAWLELARIIHEERE
jgi:hypothetical protein